MIAVIRISGIVKMNKDLEETMNRLKLRKKYACIILPEKPELLGMIKNIRNFVAFGTIDDKTLAELVRTRGKS